jgi:hypothetical protein
LIDVPQPARLGEGQAKSRHFEVFTAHTTDKALRRHLASLQRRFVESDEQNGQTEAEKFSLTADVTGRKGLSDSIDFIAVGTVV